MTLHVRKAAVLGTGVMGAQIAAHLANAMGHLIGMLGKESVYLEGVLARLMYRSLYKMHQQALHGTAKTALDMAAHLILRRTEPRIKLH